MAIDNKTKTKAGIYAGNFLTPSAIGLFKNVPKLGEHFSKIPGLDYVSAAANAKGALFFGAWDLFGAVSKKFNDSKVYNLVKAAGAVGYSAAVVKDLANIAGGDWKSLVDFVFDASMAYQLGRDTLESYTSGRDLIDDVQIWKKSS